MHEYNYSICLLLYIIDVLGRKNAINKYLEKIKCSVASIDDPNTLDRILALMMKANASTAISDSNPPSKFEKIDHFAPRQKNENTASIH